MGAKKPIDKIADFLRLEEFTFHSKKSPQRAATKTQKKIESKYKVKR